MQQDAPGSTNGSDNSSDGDGTGTELGDSIEEQVGGGPGNSTSSTNETNETAAGAGNETAAGNESGNATASANESAAGGGGDGAGMSATQGPTSGDGGGLLGFDVESYVTESAAVVRDALQDLGTWAFDAVIELIVGTGAPDTIVGAPTNEPWLTLYNYAHSDVAMLSTILFAFVVAAIAASGTFAGIFSAYKTRQLWWRAGAAIVFDIFWWPLGAAGLQVIDWLALEIAPSGSEFTSSVEGAIAGVAGAAIGGAVLHTISTGAILLLGLLYGARWVALAALLVFMRVLVMLWVVDASVFSRLSNLASGFMNMFVPLLVMPLPTAMLMRVSLLFFMAAASGNAGILSGPVLVFVALGTLVASVFAPKYTFDYAKEFMGQSFGAEKLGQQLDAKLGALGAGIADSVGGDGDGGGSSSGTTATLETPPALPSADPTATPSTGSGGSGAPAAPATEPVTAMGTTTATTATGGSGSSSSSPSASASAPSSASSTNTATSTASSHSTTTATEPKTEDPTVNKYLQESEYSTGEQRLESRRRQLRQDTAFYGGDD